MARAGLDNAIDGHGIESIAFILDKDPILAEKWSELATKLGIGLHRIKKFREDIRLDKITHADLISGILELWKGQAGSAARFDKLQHAVKELGAVNVGESLEALQATAEIENYSGQYVKALQMELAGLQAKNFGPNRELVSKSNIIERKDREIELLTKEYQNLLHEKSSESKAVEKELLGLGAQIKVQQCQLNDMKIVSGNQNREITGLKYKLDNSGQENIMLNQSVARLTTDNNNLKRTNEEKGQELMRSEQERNKFNADVTRLETDNEYLKQTIEEMGREMSKYKNLYFKNENWDSELHLAVNRMDESAIHKLVENEADLEATNKRSETPLHRASYMNNESTGLRVIKYLIDKGANAYAKNNENRPFLYFLVDKAKITPSQFHDFVTYLASKNLSRFFTHPSLCEYSGLRLAFAKIEVRYETLLILRDNGFDLAFTDMSGYILNYPLWGRRSTKLISDLIRIGADWNHLDCNGSSLLHVGAYCCHVEGVKYLINIGLDVNALDYKGNTPLHSSIMYAGVDNLNIARVLIENGANIKLKNKEGKTPLDMWLARNVKNEELVQMLTLKK